LTKDSKKQIFMNSKQTVLLKEAAFNELTQNILPYWHKNALDDYNGGFVGSIDGKNKIDYKASKGAVLNTRILWTFSKAFNVLQKKEYFELAKRAYNYINTFFRDKEYNGVFWELDYKGNPINTRKYCYTQGFWIYALSEFYKASKDPESIELAMDIFSIIEDKALDKTKNGYIEAFDRNWTITGDVRISKKDLNEKKTYNTHLHLLEGYTALFAVTKNETVKKALHNLIDLMIGRFYNPLNDHFLLFFDENWNIKSDLVSYGHDIEGTWLLWEAVKYMDMPELEKQTLPVVIKIVDAILKESIDKDGGQFYEGTVKEGVKDTDKHWWPQAEAVVGFLNAWSLTGNKVYLDYAVKSWNFIEKYISDKRSGEWFWKTDKNGLPYTDEVKAGFWKCPYHNSRSCFEIIKRTNS
jgi:cellobiose epimerase